MFDEAGSKLKFVVYIAFVLGVIGTVVLGILLGRDKWGDFNFFRFLLILVIGVVGCYLSLLVLAAFAEMAEDIKYIATHLPKEEKRTAPAPINTSNSTSSIAPLSSHKATSSLIKQGAQMWTCPKCGRTNSMIIGTCSCGQEKPKL